MSDNDIQFNSKFYKHLAERWIIKHNTSTAYDPQTDGQTDVMNQILEDYLYHYTRLEQDK